MKEKGIAKMLNDKTEVLEFSETDDGLKHNWVRR